MDDAKREIIAESAKQIVTTYPDGRVETMSPLTLEARLETNPLSLAGAEVFVDRG